MSKWISMLLVATGLMWCQTSLYAYTISPKTDIHESLTRTSLICFNQALKDNARPVSCPAALTEQSDDIDTTWIHDSSISFFDFRGWYKRMRGFSAKYPDLEEAVRWPDDPTRQIGVKGIVKFSVNMLTSCDQYLSDNPEGRNDINDGLLCNSHNGDMQFLHSQASSIGEPALDTYRKVRGWAGFLYKVASGHLSDEELDQEYCSYFSGDDVFSKAMLPGQDAVPCESVKDPKWRLTTLFTFKCPNPLSSKGCYEEVGSSRFDKARINATGALLHLIQDSYSQSHAERGHCEMHSGEARAKVECLPLARFTTYRGQIRHGDADKIPLFGQDCSVGGMSPTLAGAVMLWHIDQGSPLKDFYNDFEEIFGKETFFARSALPASLGQCFTATD